MKVFISHSSRDKWIARKLSEEICKLDCITFLDEKDIETGQSIDEEIGSHLNESDDFLLLLTPDSIKSHWVLIELGGALALKKRIVIVLLYLGANDIPQPISKYLARDINDIEKYYSEIKQRISGKTNIETPKELLAKENTKRVDDIFEFTVGEIVQLPFTKPSRIRAEIGWTDHEMDKFLGQKAEIIIVDKNDNTVQIKDGETYWWAFEWLTKTS